VRLVQEPWLAELEQLLASSDEAIAVTTVASVAGRTLELDDDERRAAGRRALLVLASGGDPTRGLDLDGPAVSRLAAELDRSDRRDALEDGLFRLLENAKGFPHLSETVRALLGARDVAWRAFACSLLAEQLADDGD
jgi:hypothetical protein